MSTATRRALYGTMAGDGTLAGLLAAPAPGYVHGIYYQSAPDTANFPLIIFNKQSGVATDGFRTGGYTPTGPGTITHSAAALDTEVWLIKAIDHNSTADTAEAIAERLRALLNDQTLSLAGGATHLYLRRDSDVDYQELAAGETYIHCGSLYRLVLDPA